MIGNFAMIISTWYSNLSRRENAVNRTNRLRDRK